MIKNFLKKNLRIDYYLKIRAILFPFLKSVIFLERLFFFPLGYIYFCVINLKMKTRVAHMITNRIGHMVINTDLYLKRNYNGFYGKERIYFLVEPPIANLFLLDKWKTFTRVVDIRNQFIFGRMLRSLIYFNCFVRELPYCGNEYLEWNTLPFIMEFTKKEKCKGEECLKDMGISEDDWFVCIFARDSAYLDTVYPGLNDVQERVWAYHDYRDSDIDTLNLAIQEILDRGGWVIRLGKIVAKEMSFKHPRVIDYPFSEWRSDFMDIYLQYRAKFVLSSTVSGATDVVTLFGTPYCGVNMPYNYNIGYKHAIHIPQKFYRNKKFLSLREWIEIVKSDDEIRGYLSSSFYEKHHLKIVNNSPEEILDLVKEMFERLEGRFFENEEDKLRQEKYLEIYSEYQDFKECKNPIGRQFLRDNPWYLE